MTFDDVGAQIAARRSLDQDGDVEIITSLDTQNSTDRGRGGRPFVVARAAGQAPRSVQAFRLRPGCALAATPPDGPGRAPFVVATTDEIHVVR